MLTYRIDKGKLWLIWEHGIYKIEIPVTLKAIIEYPDIIRQVEKNYLPNCINQLKKKFKNYDYTNFKR